MSPEESDELMLALGVAVLKSVRRSSRTEVGHAELFMSCCFSPPAGPDVLLPEVGDSWHRGLDSS